MQVTTIETLEAGFKERIASSFTYGDFQYRNDEKSPGLLRDGVMSCYQPVPEGFQTRLKRLIATLDCTGSWHTARQ